MDDKSGLDLETDSPIPLALGARRDLSQFFSLWIDGALVPLDPNAARVVEATSGPSGLVRVDAARPFVLACAVDPGLFAGKTSAQVRAVFTSGAHAPEGAWVGTIRSEPVSVEVR